MIAEWVLVIISCSYVCGSQAAIEVHSIPGFALQADCYAAAREIEKPSKRRVDITRTACVKRAKGATP